MRRATTFPARERADALSDIRQALDRALTLMLAEDYGGYDPYDALASSLFELPLVGSSRLVRRGAQQVVRRLPVNIRSLLLIPKGRNPVTLGLALQSWALLGTIDRELRERSNAHAATLVSEIADARSAGWSGPCWGYDFPWEARDATLPAGAPTVVATGFVTNGLFVAHERLGTSRALELCVDACSFVRRDLRRTPGTDGSFCWSYSPFDASRVLNATAKGSRLLAQVASATGDSELLDDAARSLAFVASHQRADGSWPYAVGDPRGWADNFHTAYVLDALAEHRDRTGDERFADTIERGWRYYRENFFADGWLPKYFDSSLYPIDSTAVAQAMITLCRFGDTQTAVRIGAWAAEHLQLRTGGFAYRMYRHHRNNIHYMRWSTAWMVVALASVLYSLAGQPE